MPELEDFDIARPSTWLNEDNRNQQEAPKIELSDSYQIIAVWRSRIIQGIQHPSPARQSDEATSLALVEEISRYHDLRNSLCMSAKDLITPPRRYQWQGITGLFLRVPKQNPQVQIKESVVVSNYLAAKLYGILELFEKVRAETDVGSYIYMWRLLSVAEVVTQCIQLVECYRVHLEQDRTEEYAGIVDPSCIAEGGSHVYIHKVRVSS